MSQRVGIIVALLSLSICLGYAGEEQAELDKLKKEIDSIRAQLASRSKPVASSAVDKALESKYGPNATVTTKTGKLRITGLVQIWYYSIQNDNRGLFDDPDVNGVADTNEASDNDGFQVKRTDLRFDMDIHENVTAVLWIDPAREATSFPAVGNQGLFKRGVNSGLGAVQTGAGGVPRLIQDAYINYHGVIPHHDFQIGQYRPALGEEGIRLNAQLDFAERSMIGQLTTNRDTGVQVHGTWLDDRLQYWAGIFNGPGNYYLSGGQTQNRADDNDEKDFQFRIMGRPLWKHETWGSLEFSFSSMFGTHGEASGGDPVGAAINGLNRNQSFAMRHYAHAYYAPGGPVKGWWLRGEWAYIKDRNAPGAVVDLAGVDPNGPNQTIGNPFSSQGWYAATGYKIADSIFCDSAPAWLKPFEFAARYDTFENVQTADLTNAAQTDNFRTTIWTGGINYYIKGHNAKIQLNYNVVDDPGEQDNASRRLHDVSNDNFVINFQVWF